MGGEYCCEKFKEEYESDCIRQDTEIFKYSLDRKGYYYLIFEGNIASAPLAFCPYCGKRLINTPNQQNYHRTNQFSTSDDTNGKVIDRKTPSL